MGWRRSYGICLLRSRKWNCTTRICLLRRLEVINHLEGRRLLWMKGIVMKGRRGGGIRRRCSRILRRREILVCILPSCEWLCMWLVSRNAAVLLLRTRIGRRGSGIMVLLMLATSRELVRERSSTRRLRGGSRRLLGRGIGGRRIIGGRLRVGSNGILL